MNNKITTSRLIASAIQERLKYRVQFGLLAQSLPPFDTFTLYEALNPDPNELRLALLGFDDVDSRFPFGITDNVETAISWRNDPLVTAKLVVVLNPTIPIEKTHSLSILEPFTDQDLRRAICELAEKESREKGDYLGGNVWHALGLVKIPFVATQIANFYDALKKQQVGLCLPYIGLLPDPELTLSDNINKKLLDNYSVVDWMSSLDRQSLRTLARAISDGQDTLQQTFRDIKLYSNSPTREILQKLTFGNVISLRDAPKSPKPKSSRHKIAPSGDVQLIDQLLKISLEHDPDKHLQAIQNIEDQAHRISLMFLKENQAEDSDNNIEDQNDEDEKFEVSFDSLTGEEIGRVDKFKGELRHPLDEFFQVWLRYFCWGGELEVNWPSIDDVSLEQIFNGKTSLRFQPLRPLDPGNQRSLLQLFKALDEVSADNGLVAQLVDLFQVFAEQRRFLLKYQDQFLYYPQYAVQDQEIRSKVESYLATYQNLSQQLHQVGRRLQENYPDAVEKTIAQFLILDTIFVQINIPQGDSKSSVLLTTMHPLHLWKWVQLANYFSDLSKPLSSKEQERVRQATLRLPTILNTFLIHPAMYPGVMSTAERHFVLAGEINNPENDVTIGIPYYQPIGERVGGDDGIKQFTDLLPKFLVLYPPAQIGLTLVLIDPPRLSLLLEKITDFSHGLENEVHLEGAKIFIYWTKNSTYDEWQSRDEEALQFFREDPQWMLYIDLEVRNLEQIHKELLDHQISPHLILICDPSSAVARSTFRTVRDEATPFGVPIQLTYDQISNSLQVIPAATGYLFDIYTDLRHILSGDLNRTILGVGSQGAKREDLERFLLATPKTHWLAILDWPQGTLELSTSLGRRLVWLSAKSRNLIIHTTQNDWEQYWEAQINYKIKDWRLSVSPTKVLNSLLELVPLFSNGMLDLIQSPSTISNYASVLDETKIAEMLGVMAVLNWYRQDKPGLVLLPIGGQDFRDWYGETEFKELIPPYYLSLWIEDGILKMDALTIHTSNPNSPTYSIVGELDHLALFTQSLIPLFDKVSATFILTPLRQAILRERFITAVYSPSALTDKSLLAQSKITKAQWAKLINELFSLSYKPKTRILQVNVDFEVNNKPVRIDRIYDTSMDGYEKYQVSLPGSFIEPGSLVETFPSTPSVPKIPVPHSEDTENQTMEIEIGKFTKPIEPSELVSIQASRLRRVLEAYGLAIAGVDISKSQIGPRFIRYWVQLLPPAGRLSEIQKYAEDIAREMGCRTIPFIDNIPGEKYVGIDLPRDEPIDIPLYPALEKLPLNQQDQLFIAAGQNASGEDVQLDITRLPHMLVAGQTGSGKTVFLSTLITSIAWRHIASNLQLILVDPKQMDFGIFETLPHLQNHRILYEPDEAIEALRNLLQVERPRRTELIRQANCPNNLEYNRRFPKDRLPWLVVVIDEFADLILSLNKRERDEFEKQVNRLAATGRAVGIHLIIATQRPTTDVITGTLKANISARISFRLPSQIDSRTILDRIGADNLLGRGDMLVSFNNDVQRLQGYFSSYDELRTIIAKIEG